MSNKVLLKKSSVAAKVPLTTDLDYGELAINYADEKLYFKNSLNQVKSFTTAGAGGSAALDFQTYTASASQTTFSVSYTAPFVNVYVNGVRLSSADYTATSGSNVILSIACSAGDIVNLVGFTSLTIGYGLPSLTGNSGKYLTTDGSTVSWGTVVAGGGTTTNALTIGTGLSGTSFNGSSAVTIAIDSTVATLTGAQTLTNKTLTLPTIGGTGATFNGSTSGTTVLKATATAGTTTITMPATTGTMALTSDIPTVNAGTLGASAATAGLTNTAIALNFSAAWNANSASNVTINPVVGPAITNLATFMTTATAGFIKRSAQDTYVIDTNTYLTANQSISLTGDITGSGTTSIATTLATVNSNVGTFNNITINAKGLATAGSNVAYLTSVIPANFASQTANTVLAAPSGAAGTPTFRALVALDIPTLNQNTTGSAGSVTNTLTIGTGLSGTSFNGSAAVTVAIDSTVATLTGSQTLTNKTLTSPTINSGAVSGTFTGAPTFSDTTASTSSTTGAVKIGGGLGVAGNIYVGSASKVGFVNASNVSVVYQVYNATAGGLDTVFA